MIALSSCCALTPCQAQATGRGGLVTRTVAAFADLEESLQRAFRERKPALAEQLLDDDFQMIVAQDPGTPVTREDWLAAMLRPGAGNWAPQQVQAREFGPVAVVSFVLRPAPARPGTAPLFVVDTWLRVDASWRLTLRQVAPATGPRRGIPGDAPGPVVRKKI